MRLEFLAGLMALPPDADEQDQIGIAQRVGLDSAAVARIFKKTLGAASMAMLRARRKK
jgi:methylphosphotriester-DNA--protein-cysteine methyltransferase